MARTASWFSGFFKALLFVAVFLLASAVPSHSAVSPAPALDEPPAQLMSLQDQCLSRAERSSNPDRARAICIGWALLALEKSSLRPAKATALRDACLREVQFGGQGEIREFRAQGVSLCQNLHATVAE